MEESAILNLDSIMIRNSHERPEGMDETTVIMSGLNKNRGIEAVEVATAHNSNDKRLIKPVKDYEADNVSKKVLRIHFQDFMNSIHEEINYFTRR